MCFSILILLQAFLNVHYKLPFRATVLTDEKDQLNLMLFNAALIPTRQHIHIGFHFSLLLNVRPKTNKNGFVLMFSC